MSQEPIEFATTGSSGTDDEPLLGRGDHPSDDEQGQILVDLTRHQRGLNSEETDESNSDTLKEDVATFRRAITEPNEESHMLEVAKIIYPEIVDDQLIGAVFCSLERLKKFDAIRSVFPEISHHTDALLQYFEADEESSAYRNLVDYTQQACAQKPNDGNLRKEKRLRAIATHKSKEGYSLLHTAAEFLDHQMMNILLMYDAAECVDVFHKNPGQESQSPLTSAVLADCRQILKDTTAAREGISAENVVEDEDFERKVATLADNQEYMIWELLNQSQQPVDALCAAIELNDPRLLDYILSLPKFLETSVYDAENGVPKPYRLAINSVGTVVTVDAVNSDDRVLQKLHPLTMASRYCDQGLFERLIGNGAQFDWEFANSNTVFHDAVLGADTTDQDHLDFFDYLLKIRPDLLNRLKDDKETTALSLACSLGKVALIEKLTADNFKSEGDIPGLARSLFVTAYYGKVTVLKTLLERCSVQSEADLRLWEDSERNPYRLALNQERLAILRPKDQLPKAYEREADWVGVQEELLTFVHSRKDTVARDNIVAEQRTLTEVAINAIEDVTVREPMLATLEQLKNDYVLNIPGNQNDAEFQRIIKQNNKILGIMNELKTAAEAFVSNEDRATIPTQLMKCCHHKMYSGQILKLLTVVGSAILGAIILTAAVVAASILASGGPAVVITAAPAAKAGFNGGLVAGAAIVGGVAGASISTVKEFGQDIKYSWRLWNIGRAMNKSAARPVDEERLLGAAVDGGGHNDLDFAPLR